MNREATRLAHSRGEEHGGGEKWYAEDIQKVVDAIHRGATYQEPPERICARCIKIFVTQPQPFNDCNHRTMTLLTYAILRGFYPYVRVNDELWEGVREKIDGWSEREIEWWIYHAIIEKTFIQPGSRSNSKRISSSQASNSSSVIDNKYAPSPIKSLWQLHAEGIAIEDYNASKDRFYEAGWWTEARPSKRFIGRFDMYIKKR
jgi:hypothetical protein